MFIDIAVGLALLAAIWIGYQRGVVQPLLVEIFFLLAILLIFRDRHAYMDAMQRYLHASAVLAVFLALVVAVVAGFIGGQIGATIHQMPVVRGVDGFLGVFVHAGFVVLVSYLLLSALVTLDKAFGPTLSAASLTAKQASALAAQLQSNPLTSMLVSEQDLAKLQAQAKQPGGAQMAAVPQLDQLQSLYGQFLEPQLAGSRSAPIILGIGQRIPVLGRVGPRDLPATGARTSAPSPGPSPTPTRR